MLILFALDNLKIVAYSSLFKSMVKTCSNSLMPDYFFRFRIDPYNGYRFSSFLCQDKQPRKGELLPFSAIIQFLFSQFPAFSAEGAFPVTFCNQEIRPDC